jgi:glycosyltransferase involved in cell wall biosynthesis
VRICLINLDFRPYRTSGHAIYGELLADGLCAAGHQVTMVASQRGNALRRQTLDGIEVIRVPIGATDWMAYSFRAAREVRRLERERHFDIVHFLDLHFAYAYRGDFLATLVQPFRQRLQAKGSLPYSHSLLNLAFRYTYYTLASLTFERWAAERVKVMLATCQAVRDAYVRDYPAEAQHIVVVPEGIDVTRYQRRDSQGLRARLGLTGKQILLYVGFSTPRKGLEYLGEALDDLGPDCRLLMVGKWEKGYRDKFFRSLGPNSQEKVIEVGYVPDEEMSSYYSLADVFVLPSLLEGFGLPLAEAMACGTAVVATHVGSIPEVVGNAGLLVPPMDSQALAAALRRMLEDEGLRNALGACGVQRARGIYSQEKMIASTLDVYRSYLASAA